jgi:hypothetical protein
MRMRAHSWWLKKTKDILDNLSADHADRVLRIPARQDQRSTSSDSKLLLPGKLLVNCLRQSKCAISYSGFTRAFKISQPL